MLQFLYSLSTSQLKVNILYESFFKKLCCYFKECTTSGTYKLRLIKTRRLPVTNSQHDTLLKWRNNFKYEIVKSGLWKILHCMFQPVYYFINSDTQTLAVYSYEKHWADVSKPVHSNNVFREQN